MGIAWTDFLETGQAVIWEPGRAGRYEVRALLTDPNDLKSEAKAINNYGVVVGTRTMSNGFTGAFRITLGAPDIFDALSFGAQPEDINDWGDIIGGPKRLNEDGTIKDFEQPPPADGLSYNFAYFYALNEHRQSGGFAKVASGSIRRAVRYSEGLNGDPLWDYISSSLPGPQDSAYGINEGGDVVSEVSDICGVNLSPMVFLDDGEGGGTRHCLQDLIVTPGWFPINANLDADINDSRQIVIVAKNSQTGQSGAVLLTPGESINMPEQPQNLAATTHAAVGSSSVDNWNGIQVSWSDTGNESSYKLERCPTGTDIWTEIASPPMNATSCDDKTGPTGETYDYRLSAVNALGTSDPSNFATATAPTSSQDNEPPDISIIEPEPGQISGNVKVKMKATDNVGVTLVKLIASGGVNLICEVPFPTDEFVTCSWNTRKVNPGNYNLTAVASDAAGKDAEHSITVTVNEKQKGGGPKNQSGN